MTEPEEHDVADRKTRNEISDGNFNGPVGQFGSVHGDVHLALADSREEDFSTRDRTRREEKRQPQAGPNGGLSSTWTFARFAILALLALVALLGVTSWQNYEEFSEPHGTTISVSCLTDSQPLDQCRDLDTNSSGVGLV